MDCAVLTDPANGRTGDGIGKRGSDESVVVAEEGEDGRGCRVGICCLLGVGDDDVW